ncbi:Na+-driven multidrug efflux pump [Primorskyibacter flagellatus]|uniref:Na+-driven multidrug efflux pump n=2 Tax=Primorskyibacter flagellatus TaxID=1387277 RepID=A0A1W2EK79_9RHOB|nr:Na+-driven multidrug efflux pump [Primorskyibacter flagellatus]
MSDIFSRTTDIPTTRAVFDLAWPMTIKAIMVHGIVVIDAWLVSSLGESAVAVLGLSASIAGLLLGLIVAFSTATQIRVAQAFGTGDRAFLKSALWSGLIINLCVIAIGLTILGFSAGGIIDALAHTDWIADQARRYITVFALVIVSEAIGQCLTSFFNGCGETRLPLYSYLLAVPINVSTSVILIHGLYGAPEFGVVGAAMGSALASALQAGFLATVLMIRTGFLLRVTGWRNGTFLASLRRHLVFALPIATTFASATIAMNVCGLIYAAFPVNQFAAMTIIMPWVQVAGTFGMSWAQATGIIVAQLLGRGQSGDGLDGFLAGAWRGALVAATVVAAIYAVIVIASPIIYSDLHTETRAMLMTFLPILLVLPFPKGSNAICGNTLRAGGETVYVMHIFVWSQWLFRVPATAVMVLYLDLSVTWVFSLLLIEEIVKFAPFHLRMYKGDWKQGGIDD